MPSASPSVWDETAPLALALKPENSVLPPASLVPFELLAQGWSSKRVRYAGPDTLRRGSRNYALHITKRLIEFYRDYFKVLYSLPKLELPPIKYLIGCTIGLTLVALQHHHLLK